MGSSGGGKRGGSPRPLLAVVVLAASLGLLGACGGGGGPASSGGNEAAVLCAEALEALEPVSDLDGIDAAAQTLGDAADVVGRLALAVRSADVGEAERGDRVFFSEAALELRAAIDRAAIELERERFKLVGPTNQAEAAASTMREEAADLGAPVCAEVAERGLGYLAVAAEVAGDDLDPNLLSGDWLSDVGITCTGTFVAVLDTNRTLNDPDAPPKIVRGAIETLQSALQGFRELNAELRVPPEHAEDARKLDEAVESYERATGDLLDGRGDDRSARWLEAGVALGEVIGEIGFDCFDRAALEELARDTRQ